MNIPKDITSLEYHNVREEWVKKCDMYTESYTRFRMSVYDALENEYISSGIRRGERGETEIYSKFVENGIIRTMPATYLINTYGHYHIIRKYDTKKYFIFKLWEEHWNEIIRIEKEGGNPIKIFYKNGKKIMLKKKWIKYSFIILYCIVYLICYTITIVVIVTLCLKIIDK